jgi:hypothetical protein
MRSKEGGIGGTCRMHVKMKDTFKVFVGKPEPKFVHR